ncbi:hypothetical protein GN956_G14185 [Arapaima gigas]
MPSGSTPPLVSNCEEETHSHTSAEAARGNILPLGLCLPRCNQRAGRSGIRGRSAWVRDTGGTKVAWGPLRARSGTARNTSTEKHPRPTCKTEARPGARGPGLPQRRRPTTKEAEEVRRQGLMGRTSPPSAQAFKASEALPGGTGDGTQTEVTSPEHLGVMGRSWMRRLFRPPRC